MIYHMDVMKAAISILNPGQVPIIMDDQSLYCVNIYIWKTDSVELANNLRIQSRIETGLGQSPYVWVKWSLFSSPGQIGNWVK